MTAAAILAIINTAIAVLKQIPGLPAEIAGFVTIGEQVFLSAEAAYKQAATAVDPTKLQPIADVPAGA